MSDYGQTKTESVIASEAWRSSYTSKQIKAITGHKTDRMVSHYVAGAKQKERAKAAMGKLEAAQHAKVYGILPLLRPK